MRTRVKLCGLSRPGDVAAACSAGADAVGFVCHPASPRYVPAQRLQELVRELAPFVTPVLLFVDAPRTQIEDALRHVPGAWLQFHGRETPEECASYARPYLRAIPVGEGVDLLDWQTRFASANAVLLDAPAAAGGPAGGTGRSFDWSRVPPRSSRRGAWILAGGLDPENVGAAIAAMQPDAVDVSSGIEESRGVKSVSLMRSFVDAVRRADDHLAGRPAAAGASE